jgi:hypothetical protein
VACARRFGRAHVTLTSRVSGFRKGGARGLNTSTSEVVSGASVWPSLRLHVAGASEEGAIPISCFLYLISSYCVINVMVLKFISALIKFNNLLFD